MIIDKGKVTQYCQQYPLLKLERSSEIFFMQLGLNEADTFKSSSILIYLSKEQSIYSQNEAT